LFLLSKILFTDKSIQLVKIFKGGMIASLALKIMNEWLKNARAMNFIQSGRFARIYPYPHIKTGTI